MTKYLVYILVIAGCYMKIFTAEDIAEDYQKPNSVTLERRFGRAYSFTTCDYRTQIGYTCLTCNRALHCYPGNAAILVDCAGMFRYCRDGRCSRFQGDKCELDTKITTPSSFTNDTMQADEAAKELNETSPDEANDVTKSESFIPNGV